MTIVRGVEIPLLSTVSISNCRYQEASGEVVWSENTKVTSKFLKFVRYGFICYVFFGFKIQRQDPVTFGSLRRVRDRTCSGCVLDKDKTLLFIHSSVPVLYCCVSTSVRT